MFDWRFTQYHCPSCRYDVAQTLTDGFDRCPECGVAIDWESCHRPEHGPSSRSGSDPAP